MRLIQPNAEHGPPRVARDQRSLLETPDQAVAPNRARPRQSWSDAVLLDSARRLDRESRAASADLARLEADRARRLVVSASLGAARLDVRRSNGTATIRIELARDLIETLALRQATVEAELVKRALQLEKESRSEARSSLPGEQETLAADAAAVTTAGPV